MIMEHMYISIALFAVAVIVSLMVMLSSMNIKAKLIIVVLMVLSGFFTYRGFNKFYGYPTILQASFDDVLIISHLLDREKGVIHLWLKSDGENPRSYTVPFKRPLAKFLEKMQAKMRGKPYRVEIETKTDSTSPFGNIVDEIDIGVLPVFPPKPPIR